MRDLEQGWSSSDKRVCSSCVEDYALADAVQSEASEAAACSFCRRRPAAEFDVLTQAFVAGLHRDYGYANDEGVSFEDGEYQGASVLDSWDLINDEGGWVLTGPGVLEEMQGVIDDEAWVAKDFAALRRDHALLSSWREFSEQVMYRTRYVIWLAPNPNAEIERMGGEIPAAEILAELGNVVVRRDLIRSIPAGQVFWRAQRKDPDQEWTAARLGTATPRQALLANRMSPAGIPLFYGSVDADTAVSEVTHRDSSDEIIVGAFEASRSFSVLDLTRLEEPPSLFDPANDRDTRRRHELMFLRQFVQDLSRPAASGAEQIDYVPTQILTEYFLRVFAEGAVVEGILYPSATRDGGVSVVLDVPQTRCVDQSDGWRSSPRLVLGLDASSRHTASTDPQ